MTPERALVDRARAAVDEYRRRLGDSKPLDWDDPKALNHGVKVVVECIAEALAEYAREQVEHAIIRAPSTGQIDLHAMYNHARAEAAAARQREEEAKGLVHKLQGRWSCQDCGSDLGDERYCRACVRTRFVQRSEYDALRAENDRLTLAASESARTLQVEIERLKARTWTDAEKRDALVRALKAHACVEKPERGLTEATLAECSCRKALALAALPQDGA